jgi:hypothetical protein
VEQCHATSEISLDVRRARYREGHLSDAAQIARFGGGGAFEVGQHDRSSDKRDETNGASPIQSHHFKGYVRMNIPQLQNKFGLQTQVSV